MRNRIMVISRDAGLRARLAELARRGGYRESLAHARRAGLDGVALAVVALDGLDAEQAVAELRATAGKVLAVAPPGKKHASFSDVVSLGDEAALLARISEALAPQREPEPIEKALEFAGYRLDVAGHSLKNSAGREVPLTPREFCLLRAFAQKAGRVLSRDQLLQLTVGRDAEAYDRSVDMQILRLRRKIEPDPKRPSLIITVPGGGYKFAEAVRRAKPPPRPQPAPAAPARSDAALRAPERRHVTALVAELALVRSGRVPSDPEDLSAMVRSFRRTATDGLDSAWGRNRRDSQARNPCLFRLSDGAGE